MPEHIDDNEIGSIRIAEEDNDLGGPDIQPPPEWKPTKSAAPRRRSLPRPHPWLWVALSPIIAILLYLAFGFLLVPHLATATLPDRLGKRLDRPVTIAGASFNPFTLKLSLRNGIVGPLLSDPADPVDPVLSFERLVLDIEAASLFRRGLICHQVSAEKLFLHLVRKDDNSYNLVGMGERVGLPLYSLNNVSIEESRILFDDLPAKKQHTAEHISLSLPSISNMKYTTADLIQPHFSAVVNGSPFELTGEASLQEDGIRSRYAMDLEEINLPAYASYLPLPEGVSISKGGGRATLELVYRSTSDGSREFSANGRIALSDVAIDNKDGHSSLFQKLEIDAKLDPLEKKCALKELRVEGAEMHFIRSKEGRWVFSVPELAGIFSGEASADGGWQVALGKMHATGVKVSLHDRKVTSNALDVWSDLQLTIDQPESPAAPADFEVTAQNSDGSRITGRGHVQRHPFRVDMNLAAQKVSLPRFSRYVKQSGPVTVRQGTASKAELQMLYESAPAGKSPVVKFPKVSADMSGLTLTLAGSDILRLKNASLTGAAVDGAGNIDLGKITGQEGSIQLTWDANGRSNWADFLSPVKPGVKAVHAPRKRFAGIDLSGVTTTLQTPGISGEKPLLLENASLKISPSDTAGKPGYAVACNASLQQGSVAATGILDDSLSSGAVDLAVDNVSFSAAGTLLSNWVVAETAGGKLQAAGVLQLPALSFAGTASVAQPMLKKANQGEAFSIKTITAEGLQLAINPAFLSVNRLKLDTPVLTWPISKEGKAPFSGLFRQGPAGKASPAVPPVIDEVIFENGTLTVLDTRLATPYKATVGSISGSITMLGNTAGKPAMFSFVGTYPGGSAVSAKGAFAADGSGNALDAVLNIDSLPLANLPHLEAALGTKISGGTAKGSTAYIVAGAKKAVKIDYSVHGLRTAAGSKTAGPKDAAMLIALMTGPDNSFAFSHEDSGASAYDTLTKQLRGLMLKMTVSPLALLTDFLPDPAAAAQIIFSPGSAQITEQHRENLDRLAAVLKNRPGLVLQFTGSADGTKDRNAMLAKKEAALLKQQIEASAKVSQQLSTTYGKEVIQPGVPAGGQAAVPPPPQPPPPPPKPTVSDAELLQLAAARIATAQAYLTEKAGSAKGRIAAGKPKIAAGQAKSVRDECRVDFLFSLQEAKNSKPQ